MSVAAPPAAAPPAAAPPAPAPPVSPMREARTVWFLTLAVGLLPLLLRVSGNMIDPNDTGMKELQDVDLLAKDLLLFSVVTIGLGLVTTLSKFKLLRIVSRRKKLMLPGLEVFGLIIFLLVFGAFFYGEAAGSHAHAIWPATGLLIGTLIGSLSLEVASVAMAVA